VSFKIKCLEADQDIILSVNKAAASAKNWRLDIGFNEYDMKATKCRE